MSAAEGTVLITGANGDISSAIIEEIGLHPNSSSLHGLYTVRNASSAATLRSVLARHPSHSHDIISLDVTSLDAVRQTAKTINARVDAGELPPIRVLILNAGFHDYDKQTWTDDGFDKTFSTNYIGHWLLTLLLLKSMDKESGRILMISSQCHDPLDKRNKRGAPFKDEKWKTVVHSQANIEDMLKGKWSTAKEDPTWRSGTRRYGASKLFQVMMMHELQRRMDRDPQLKNVGFLGIDPGSIPTGFARNASWLIRVYVFKISFPIQIRLNPNGEVRTAKKSAGYIVQAALNTDPPLGKHPKDLYLKDMKVVEPCVESNDVEKQGWLWTETLKAVDLREGETILVHWQ